jgi:hypothetical protein
MGLDIGKPPGERGNELLVCHPVRSDEAFGEVVAQVKIFDRQHFGMAEYDVAHAAGDRKGDLNVVVHRHIVDGVAERALKAWMDLVELAKAASDLRAIGADQQPVQLEQPGLGSVHEQFYRVRLGQVGGAVVVVSDGIDAKEIIVIGGSDEAFKLRQDIRRPASCRSERAQALAQQMLVDRRGDIHLMHRE